MSFINSISDEPTGETKYLGIETTCNTLVKYIESDKIVTPISIAIHGQWGSGKTNLLKALNKKLSPVKTKIVYFDAWKHEAGNPSVALAGKIMKELFANADVVNQIIKLAADALIRKTFNMQLNEVIARLNEGIDSSELLSSTLENKIVQQIGDKKLVVLIDDLDRCDIENTLQILSMLKLFLDVKNCVCVAAIDFHRVEQAWFSKYGIVEGNNPEWTKEGRQYLEKIFQIRIPIPHPEDDEKAEYLKSLMRGVPNNYIDLFVDFGPSNPRAIKRAINLISYRTFLGRTEDAEMISFIWTILEENFSSKDLISFYDILESEGGFVSIIKSTSDTPRIVLELVNRMKGDGFSNKFKNIKFFENCFVRISKLINSMNTPQGSMNSEFSRLYSATKQLQN